MKILPKKRFWGDFYNETNMWKEFKEEEDKTSVILFASYCLEEYEGEAFVLFWNRKNKQIYEVNACHCSCYGLENDGWEPEETNKKVLMHRYKRGNLRNFEESGMLLKLLKNL